MYFHFNKEHLELRIEQSVTSQQGFFRKQINPKINDFRNVQAKVYCNRLIGKTWISDNYFFQDQIEEYQINQNNIQVLLKDSLQLQIIRRNNIELQKVRRNANHRISLHTNHIVNYVDGTINGVIDERVTQDKHYIAELNLFYEDLQLIPHIIFKTWLCHPINDNLYLLQLVGNDEQINILVDQKGKQVDFYKDCSSLLGQVSYFNGYFFWFHENQLKILNQSGIIYSEQLIGKYYLYKDCAISIDSQITVETNGKNQINFLTTIKYHKLHLLLVKKEEKFKIIFAEQVVPAENVVEYLINTNDYKFIKMKMTEYWNQSKIKQQDIILLFSHLCQLKKSNKNEAKYKLLQCYQIQPKILKIQFMDCLLSPQLDCEKLIKLFQKQLLYNYIHLLILIINHRPELIDLFLPNGQLFVDIDQTQANEIKLLNKCQLNDLNYLGNDQIQIINTNYFQIAHEIFGVVFGQYRQAQLLANNFTYYLYNILIKDQQSRMTYQEFEEQPNKVNIVVSQSINIKLTLDQLKSYYDQNQLDFNLEILNQLQLSNNFAQIFQHLMNYELPQNIYVQAITLVFDKILTQSSDTYQQLFNICDAIRNQLWNISQNNQSSIHDILSNIDQIAKISEVLYNFNIIYNIHSLQTRLMKSQEDCVKCVDQLLENYIIGRVKKYQFKTYNLSMLQDLKQLLSDYFAAFVRETNVLNTIVLRKHLEFGKYRESKQICQQFLFSTQQLDQVVSQTMYRYLELQKKVESIEEERCKFQEIITEIKRIKKQELPLCKQAQNLYKFIYEIKEIGDYKFNDQQSCNQTIYQIFRRTNNLELPYLRLKKKLAKANNLEIYDLDFCRFMLDLAQRNIQGNPHRAQLIFEELQKNGNEIIQSEVSVQLLQFSTDESQKSEHYWKVLRQSQSADAISTLIRLHKPKNELNIKPKKVEILNMDLIAIPLTTKSDSNKFQNEYLKLYNNKNNKFEVVFLDKLLTDPKQAFQLLKLRKYDQQMTLIQNICNSGLLDNYKLLTLFISTLSHSQDIVQQLQQGGIVEQVAEAIIISKHKQLFNKDALFDRNSRKIQILELLNNLDLENLIPELNHFRDLDLQDLKISVFVNKLKSINLKHYYINQQESIRSVINNQIKQNPILKSIDMDCRYHWIMYQDILDLTAKEKILIRSLVNQCVLSDHLDSWDRIYRKLIEKNKDYNLIEKDLAIIVDTENNVILSEIVKTFYNQEVEFMKIYYQKLIQTKQEAIIQKWQTDCPDKWKVELLQSMISNMK